MGAENIPMESASKRPTPDQLFDRLDELNWTMKRMRDDSTDAIDYAHYSILGSWRDALSDEYHARVNPLYAKNRKRRLAGKSDGLEMLIACVCR